MGTCELVHEVTTLLAPPCTVTSFEQDGGNEADWTLHLRGGEPGTGDIPDAELVF
jgi:hypothetical protein